MPVAPHDQSPQTKLRVSKAANVAVAAGVPLFAAAIFVLAFNGNLGSGAQIWSCGVARTFGFQPPINGQTGYCDTSMTTRGTWAECNVKHVQQRFELAKAEVDFEKSQMGSH